MTCHHLNTRAYNRPSQTKLPSRALEASPRPNAARLLNILAIGALLSACDAPFHTEVSEEEGLASAGGRGDPAANSGGSVGVDSDEPAAVSPGGAPADAQGAVSASSGSSSATCPSATDLGYRLEFYPETFGETEEDLHPFFRLQKGDGQAVAVNRFKVRYYYTKEVFGDETFECFWVTGDRCADLQASFGDYEPAVGSADRYMEIRLSSSNLFLGLVPIELRTGFTIEHQPQVQSNDYSFLPGAQEETKPGEFPYQEWTKVTLYLDDQLVWGKEPCTGEDS